MTFVLAIGNKTYSSWSMRPWLAMTHAGIPFEERMVPLDEPGSPAALAAVSPSSRVPALHVGGAVIHESIAIIEYAAELAPEAGLWPADPLQRAKARALAAEMHAGFAALRAHCPMNLKRVGRARAGGLPDAVKADIARIEAIWADCRARHGDGGPYLFGAFTAVDAMFAPVTTRFTSYALPRGATADAYIRTIASDPAFMRWHADAMAETVRLPATDAVD
jgi:glutathione S-transferase